MIRTSTITWARGKTLTLAFLAAALVAAGLMLTAGPALAAATFTVDRNDDPDPTTANACTATANDCSLRGAVVAANTAAGADTITLPAGTYTLTRDGADDNYDSSTGDLDVTGELTITGAGARATSVAGGPAPFDDRIFQTGSDATITGLTITGGKTGSIGGGVLNEGDLTLDRVAVKNNNAASGRGGIAGLNGTLTITDSTVSGNSTEGSGGGVLQQGGTANITNSTISGNHAATAGGGVIATSSALMNILSSTIASNTSPRLGGGILTSVGSLVVVKNTILATNTLDNCDTAQFGGIISSQGNNISSDNSCPFTQPTDKQNTNPLLGALANNGGPTDTRALLGGSPAIDAVSSGCPPPATDQRGVARPQRTACDIGSFERLNSPPVAGNDAYNAREDTTLTRAAPGVLVNDTDVDGDTLRAALVSGPTRGTLTLNPNGSFSYRPKANLSGTDSFTYRATDGKGGTDTATVTIRIAAINDAPVITPISPPRAPPLPTGPRL